MALSPAAISVMQECVARSHAETIAFPEVVARLSAIGVEHYEADLLRGEKAYFFPNGEWHAEKLPVPERGPATDFGAAEVESAVRAIQRGEIKYNEFLRRIMAAGCIRYFVYIAGRNTAYLGRRGEIYTERFPNAN